MTREQAKANLEALGCKDVTEEQIKNYLNQLEGETNGLKTKLSKAEKDAQNVADLKKQLEDLQNSKLTDEEKAQKEAEAKATQIAELESKIKAMELKTQLAEQGIVGEDADKLIESANGGSLDVVLLGKIISEKESAAAKKKEEEIANHSDNPGGGSSGSGSGNGDDEKPADVLNAESMKDVFGTAPNTDNKDYYKL